MTQQSQLEVLATGPLALIEDLGRPGQAAAGVSRSGAADRGAHRLANRLLGNPDDRATIEVAYGGFTARVHGGPIDLAVTGADTTPRVNGRRFGTNAFVHVPDGSVITLGTPATGVRSYLAVRGGIDVAPVLGSRSYDVLAKIGPAPLAVGDRLPVGTATGAYPETDQAPVAAIRAGVVELRVTPGPRDDWFGEPDLMVRTNWLVSNRTDRAGMRLVGMPLDYVHPGRALPAEGAVRGAIQVPPDGFPIILGPDHPVTGAYPVVGVVVERDLDALAQVRPGQTIRMHWAHPRSLPTEYGRLAG